MLKKIASVVLFLILGISFYFIIVFDINNYKSEIEDIISEKSNTELISGDLELDIGSNTIIKAELLSVKNDVLILESDFLLQKFLFPRSCRVNLILILLV